MSRRLLLLLMLVPAAAMAQVTGSSPSLDQIGIDQKLGVDVPLDLSFTDESGREIQLRDCFKDRPVVFQLVYFRCPMLCTEGLNGLTRALRGMSQSAGSDFDIITLSFDPNEDAKLAAEKKSNYIGVYQRAGAADGWHFLTGKSEAIRKLTGAVGFRYAWDPQAGAFAHASGLVVLTPAGRVSGYVFGVEYEVPALLAAIQTARNGSVSAPAEKILLYCIRYNPTTGRFSLMIFRCLQLLGAASLLALTTFIVTCIRRERRRQHERPVDVV